MKRSVFLFAILSCFGSALMAQSGEQTYRVHFATDVYTLPTEAFAELDKAILTAQNSPYYEIELNAHTDYIGSGTYNEKLSENRAQSVKSYFVSKGLDPDLINAGWYGEKKPAASNLSEKGKQLNRRVEVVLKTYSFKSPAELLKTAGGDYRQQFKLKDGAQSITGKKGTNIDIPSDAFVLPDGSPVKNGETVFILEEFSSFADALYNNLSTQSNGKILESGGMMKLTATYKGQELQLAEGKTLEAQMPSNNLQAGMSVFVGNTNENGVVDWQQTQGDFSVQALNAPKLPYLKLDREFMQNYLQPNPLLPQFAQPELNLSIPIKPNLPTQPRSIRSPQKMDPDEMFSRFARIFTTKAYRERIALKHHSVAMKNFAKKEQTYNRRLKTFLETKDKYKNELAQYEAEVNSFYRQLDSIESELLRQLAQHKEYIDVKSWNIALASLVNDSEKEKLYLFEPFKQLRYRSRFNYDNDMKLKVNNLENWLNFVRWARTNDLETLNRRYSVAGKLSYDKFASNGGYWGEQRCGTYRNSSWLSNQTENCALEEYGNDPQLKEYFSKAVAQYEKEFEAAGLVSQQDLNRIYSASINNMGYINCDRFSNVPERRMAQIKIDNPENARIMVCVNRLRSIIYPSTNYKTGVSSVSLPKGEKVTIVAVLIGNDGRPHFDKRQTTVDKEGNILKMNPVPVKIGYLKASLAAL